LTLTDIASGWTECVAMPVRNQALIVEALSIVGTALPFDMLGVDTDNDSAFMNQTVFDYCRTHGLEQTRSRAYRKNDQAWVEQKNGSIVRRLVGYGRLSGLPATRALAQLYNASRLYVNFFQPSFKLKSKSRDGARVHKTYYPPATPCNRLLDSDRVSDAVKRKLRAQFEQLDPVQLLRDIRVAQQMLSDFASSPTGALMTSVESVEVTAFVDGMEGRRGATDAPQESVARALVENARRSLRTRVGRRRKLARRCADVHRQGSCCPTPTPPRHSCERCSDASRLGGLRRPRTWSWDD